LVDQIPGTELLAGQEVADLRHTGQIPEPPRFTPW
jgi:hypothetical protein